MRKKMKLLALLISLLMVFAFVGCEAEDPADSADGGEENGSAEEQGEEQAESDVHEIYTIEDSYALSGVTNPDIASRDHIYKALDTVEDAEMPIHVGFDINTLGNPFFVYLHDAMEDYAEEFGYEITITINEFNSTTQSANIESLITQDVDVLIVDPNETHAAGVDVARAVEAGIPVIGVGVAMEADVPHITTIQANSYLNGFENGQHLAEQYDPEEEIEGFVIHGGMGHPVSEGRGNGMLSGLVYGRMMQMDSNTVKEDAMLRGYELWLDVRNNGTASDEELGIHIVGSGNGSWTDEGGLSIGEDLLSANPEVDFVLASNDFMSMGFMRAAESIGLEDVNIIAPADGSQEAMELIKEGRLLSTGYNSPAYLALKTMELVQMIFEEGFDASNMRRDTNLPAIAIHEGNVDEFYDPDYPFAKPTAEFEFETLDD